MKDVIIHISGIQRLAGFAVAVTLLLLGGVSAAQAFTLSGVVNDSAGNPLPRLRVDVYDQDTISSPLLATTYTNAAGGYSVNVTGGWGPLELLPDIYITVSWRLQLLPTARYGDNHVHIMGKLRDIGGGSYTQTANYQPKTSATTNDHDPASNLAINLNMNQAITPNPGGAGPTWDDLVNLRLHIQEALDYYYVNKGSAAWGISEDVHVNILTNRIGSFATFDAPFTFPGQQGPSINIAQVDINGTNVAGVGQGFVTDIFHESGHLVHMQVRGADLPSGGFTSSHSVNTESNPTFAFRESWASYVAFVTNNAVGPYDTKPNEYRDDGTALAGNPDGTIYTYAANALWRGDETNGTVYTPTGRDGANFESGEDVEGAIGGFLIGVHQDPLGFTFADTFGALVSDKTDDFYGYTRALAALVGSKGSAKTTQISALLNTHGIIYSRVRFTANPFAAPAVSTAGSAKEIDGVMYLRGTVKTKFEEVSTTDLGVDQKISVGRVRVKYKLSNPDVSGTPSDFPAANQTPYVSFGFFSHELDLDTTILGDGEWDLLLTGENDDGFEDNLLPTWAPNPAAAPADPGDGTAAVNTEEKYLKVLGPWYDKDRDPTTNQVDEGKVIVDNTAPTVQIRKSP